MKKCQQHRHHPRTAPGAAAVAARAAVSGQRRRCRRQPAGQTQRRRDPQTRRSLQRLCLHSQRSDHQIEDRHKGPPSAAADSSVSERTADAVAVGGGQRQQHRSQMLRWGAPSSPVGHCHCVRPGHGGSRPQWPTASFAPAKRRTHPPPQCGRNAVVVAVSSSEAGGAPVRHSLPPPHRRQSLQRSPSQT